MRAVTLAGAALWAGTELLSAFHALTRSAVTIYWLSLLIAVFVLSARRIRVPKLRITRDPMAIICLLGTGFILVLTAVTATFSPPNSADAMAYHLPRVVYWAEQASVRFFPTPYLNQIMLQPFAEYSSLHLYLLSGGDRLTNLVQWFASLTSIAGVSAIAREWGAGIRGQAFAALFCASLPSGILASSGAKNDYVLAMWLVTAVYFALRLKAEPRWESTLLLGVALGLALLTKATAYLYAPWPLLAAFGFTVRKGPALALVPALVLNTPHYLRNMELSGSPLGFDSAQGNGFYRWRNESFGWKQTASNLLRNTSEQLGARSEQWNGQVQATVLALHRKLGIDPNDPSTTWPSAVYRAPRHSNHEADAPNSWHLAAIVSLACWLAVRAALGRSREQALYLLGLAFGLVAFCAYLKWQPFMARLLLPLFVLAAPVTCLFAEIRFARGVFPLVFALFLLNNARRPLFENWVRPLAGPRSVLRVPRDDQYFSDMNQWGNRESYKGTVELLAKGPCRAVGIDINNLQLEYPLQALLRERRGQTRFLHTGVGNVTARYRQPTNMPICAVACLDCAGDAERLKLYRDFPRQTEIGKFVILFK